MTFRIPTIDDPLRVLALGAGVQSSYLLLASCAGELPRLDCAIFADTMNEPDAVYTHLDWLTKIGEDAEELEKSDDCRVVTKTFLTKITRHDGDGN